MVLIAWLQGMKLVSLTFEQVLLYRCGRWSVLGFVAVTTVQKNIMSLAASSAMSAGSHWSNSCFFTLEKFCSEVESPPIASVWAHRQFYRSEIFFQSTSVKKTLVLEGTRMVCCEFEFCLADFGRTTFSVTPGWGDKSCIWIHRCLDVGLVLTPVFQQHQEAVFYFLYLCLLYLVKCIPLAFLVMVSWCQCRQT